jgi:peptide/nickel transport system ATP-binding protein
MPVSSSISLERPTPGSEREEATDLLAVKDLTVQYCVNSGRFTAVNQVSFSMDRAEIVGMLGESGCGKTSTALSLLRLLPDTAIVTGGRIYFRKRDLRLLAEKQLRELRGGEVSIIFQDSAALNPVMRVGNQVIEVLRAHSKCTSRQAREKLHGLFTSIGLLDFDRIFDAYPHQLSGGQRQRIAIAQALICEPKLVIADEPTAHLDDTTAAEILAFMLKMRETHHTSFLIISHNPEILAKVADRMIVMYAGQVVEEGSAEDVFARPLHPYTETLLRCSPARGMPAAGAGGKKRFAFIPGNSPNPLEVLPGCSFSARCADRMAICDSRQPDLLDQCGQRAVRCFKYEAQ